MDRSEIREYARILADELTEAPEGLMSDNELNTLINISQDNVVLYMAQHLPKEFRKSALISLTADKEEYDIESDIGVDNCLKVETILHNASGEPAYPLFSTDVNDLWQYSTVGEKGDPEIWFMAEKDVIGIRKIPSSDSADRLKMFFFLEQPDLNEDLKANHDPSSDKYAIPDMPKVMHPLISMDVLVQWAVRGSGSHTSLEKIFDRMANKIISLLSLEFGLTATQRPSTKEYWKGNE
ncbi:MAG TPA: hypothetical protein VFG01_07210 [Acidobacteriota bacterium]|nr:hypothetical protein [Acidobacteriota bacterium]